MERAILLAAAITATLAVMLFSGSALAASPSQEQCEAQGGTFQRTNGQVECVIVDEGKNARFTDTTTTTGQGNVSNKQQQSSACGGTGSEKCPPGQF
jgi:hypothetical protein